MRVVSRTDVREKLSDRPYIRRSPLRRVPRVPRFTSEPTRDDVGMKSALPRHHVINRSEPRRGALCQLRRHGGSPSGGIRSAEWAEGCGTSTGASMLDRLEDILSACTVRVTNGLMTCAGFFLTPTKVVTSSVVTDGVTAVSVGWGK